MNIELIKTDNPNLAPGALTEDHLARLALRYAGDDGMTVAGTAEAMEFQSRVRHLAPGDTIPLPKAKNYAIRKVSDDS